MSAAKERCTTTTVQLGVVREGGGGRGRGEGLGDPTAGQTTSMPWATGRFGDGTSWPGYGRPWTFCQRRDRCRAATGGAERGEPEYGRGESGRALDAGCPGTPPGHLRRPYAQPHGGGAADGSAGSGRRAGHGGRRLPDACGGRVGPLDQGTPCRAARLRRQRRGSAPAGRNGVRRSRRRVGRWGRARARRARRALQ